MPESYDFLRNFATFCKTLQKNWQFFTKKMRLQSCHFSIMDSKNCAKECSVQVSTRAFKRIFTCKIWLRYSRERALSSSFRTARVPAAQAAPASRGGPQGIRQTLEGSFSAVSKPNFASKYAFESSRRDLHNALLCTTLQSQFFVKFLPIFLQILQNSAEFL